MYKANIALDIEVKFRFDLQRFDAVDTDRDDVDALIPEDVQREIIDSVPQMSSVMSLGTRLPDMTRNQRRMPVLSALARAYYVDGDKGQKKTTRQAWENKFVDAEEIAVILPVPENVFDDADYDLWGQIRPRIVEAFGIAFDAAVFYGTDGFGGGAPSSWPTAIVTTALARGHAVTNGTGDDLYDEIMSEGGVISFVEEDGFNVNGHVAALTMRAKLRGLRDLNGQPLFHRSAMQGAPQWDLDGSPVQFPTNGAIDRDESLMISGDWSQLVFAIRQDISVKVLDQAVIQNPDGSIAFNLAQDDMIALRLKMRLGWQLPNPINRVNTDESTRYPFAVLAPAGS